MKTIWKYHIMVTDSQTIEMPIGAKILTVDIQRGDVCLWAEVDSESPKKPRLISIYGTGNPMHDNPGTYVGTFIMADGALVFHVYDAGLLLAD